MNLGNLLLIIMMLLLIAAFPTWPHSQDWGYVPSGSMGLVAVVILALIVTRKI